MPLRSELRWHLQPVARHPAATTTSRCTLCAGAWPGSVPACLIFFFICVALARKGLCIACTSFFFYYYSTCSSCSSARVGAGSLMHLKHRVALCFEVTVFSSVLWWPSSCSDDHQSYSVGVLSPQSKSCRRLHVSLCEDIRHKGQAYSITPLLVECRAVAESTELQ